MSPESTNLPDQPVLVVDDDEAIRRLFMRALAGAGFETLEAASGEQALSVLETNPVALVLLDSQMPGMGGVEVVRRCRAREETRTLPIILVTGQTDVSDRVRGLEAGATDYLTKPVHLDELLARVRSHLRGQAAWANLLRGELQRRSEAVAALGRIRPGETLEETAEAILSELLRAHRADFGMLVALRDDGTAMPLAVNMVDPGTYLVRPGVALPAEMAAHLRRRAEQGPWQERGGMRPEHVAGYGRTATETGLGTIVHHAPLRSGMRVVGDLVLAIGTSGDRTGLAPDRFLSAVIDYAAVASALLAPSLEAREQVGSERSVLAAILAGGAFRPVYQPIVELDGRRVVSHEALTRFADGARPDLRFAEAERLGLGFDFETETMRRAIETARRLPPGTALALNASPRLVLETDRLEHVPVDDYARFRAALARLPGIRISVDDAGAGFASLRHILELSPSYVKLDISLVRGIDADPVRQALVAGLVHFARSTGAQLVGEGIETEDELRSLRNLSVELGQGYLLGRPQPVGEPAGRATA